MSQDAVVLAEKVIANNFVANQQGGTVQTISTSGNINTNYGSVRVTTAAAVTAVTMSPGTTGGQEVTVIHEGAAANTITFAASGTSNVADGTSDVITGPSGRKFQWDAVTALWYALH